jgi:hypothetical protein
MPIQTQAVIQVQGWLRVTNAFAKGETAAGRSASAETRYSVHDGAPRTD